jgi:hypothetical protein
MRHAERCHATRGGSAMRPTLGVPNATRRVMPRPRMLGTMNIDSTTLLVLAPIIVLQLGLLIWGLYDLTRPDRRVRGDSKVLWAIVIIFIGIIGPVVYFLLGRQEA